MLNLSSEKIAVVILAAGMGKRMGDATKLLLPMPDGEPVVKRVIRFAHSLKPLETVLVVKPHDDPLSAAVQGLSVRTVVNNRWQEGMGSSLAVGISALAAEARGALVLLADMPLIPETIIARLLDAYRTRHMPITIPVYGGEVGPPTLFSREGFPALTALHGETGGRQLLAAFPGRVAFVTFNEQERPLDVDSPEDYNALLTSQIHPGEEQQ